MQPSKVVLVTGASSGIGRATALAFAREGADVALVARRKDRLDALAKEIEALGSRALVLPADLSDPAAAERIVDDAARHFGRLDVVVNNAGRSVQGFLDQSSVEQARRLFELNVLSVIASSRAALPHLASTRGAIINVSSVAGIAPMPLHGFYAASKHALIGFARSLAYELPQGVRVISVCPGPVDTEFAEKVDGMPYPAWLVAFGQRFMDRPETIARAIVRASSRRASGTVLPSFRSRLAVFGARLGPIAAAVIAIFVRRMRAAASLPAAQPPRIAA